MEPWGREWERTWLFLFSPKMGYSFMKRIVVGKYEPPKERAGSSTSSAHGTQSSFQVRPLLVLFAFVLFDFILFLFTLGSYLSSPQILTNVYLDVYVYLKFYDVMLSSYAFTYIYINNSGLWNSFSSLSLISMLLRFIHVSMNNIPHSPIHSPVMYMEVGHKA